MENTYTYKTIVYSLCLLSLVAKYLVSSDLMAYEARPFDINYWLVIVLLNLEARLGLTEIFTQAFLYCALKLKQSSVTELIATTKVRCEGILLQNQTL